MSFGGLLLALEGRHEGGPVLAAVGHDVAGLLTVANRTLLQQVVDSLAAAGVREVVVASTASITPAIRRALEPATPGRRLGHLELPAGTSPVEAVLAARRLLDDGPVVVHGDDSLVLDGMGAAMTAFTEQGLDALQFAVTADAPAPAGGGDVVTLRRRPRAVGVQILGDRALEVLEELEADASGTPGLDGVHDAVRAAGGRVRTDAEARAWRFTGEVESFLEVNRLMLDRVLAGGGDRAGDPRVRIDPTAEVIRSDVRGPVLIGPGARVVDSYVGPYTCIAADARLDGAELEYSVVLPGARIDHVGVRIVDSVIGAGAQVHRRFAMPSALRLHVGAGASVALS